MSACVGLVSTVTNCPNSAPICSIVYDTLACPLSLIVSDISFNLAATSLSLELTLLSSPPLNRHHAPFRTIRVVVELLLLQLSDRSCEEKLTLLSCREKIENRNSCLSFNMSLKACFLATFLFMGDLWLQDQRIRGLLLCRALMQLSGLIWCAPQC